MSLLTAQITAFLDSPTDVVGALVVTITVLCSIILFAFSWIRHLKAIIKVHGEDDDQTHVALKDMDDANDALRTELANERADRTRANHIAADRSKERQHLAVALVEIYKIVGDEAKRRGIVPDQATKQLIDLHFASSIEDLIGIEREMKLLAEQTIATTVEERKRLDTYGALLDQEIIMCHADINYWANRLPGLLKELPEAAHPKMAEHIRFLRVIGFNRATTLSIRRGVSTKYYTEFIDSIKDREVLRDYLAQDPQMFENVPEDYLQAVRRLVKP